MSVQHMHAVTGEGQKCQSSVTGIIGLKLSQKQKVEAGEMLSS